MRHIISILLQNEAGALSRVAGLFSARGYNIESLSVAPTQDETLSRLTLVTIGTDEVIGQINKQLSKVVDVVSMADMTAGGHFERELMLLKLRAEDDDTRRNVRELVTSGHGQILDDTPSSYTAQLVGNGGELDTFIRDAADICEILEVVRSGVAGIAQGDTTLPVVTA